MENNGSIVARAFALKIENFMSFWNCHKMISRLWIILKSRLNQNLENFVQNEFQVANQCEIEAELKFGIENSCRKVGNGLG